MRPRSPHKAKAGYILLDCLVGAFVLGIGASAFWMLLPTVSRSQILSKHQAVASEMASRMAEELQSLSVGGMTGANLKSLNLIDSDSPTTTPFNFSNVPLDQATQYSPSTALPSGTGTLSTTGLPNGAMMVTINISWTESSGATNYQTATIIGSYR